MMDDDLDNSDAWSADGVPGGPWSLPADIVIEQFEAPAIGGEGEEISGASSQRRPIELRLKCDGCGTSSFTVLPVEKVEANGPLEGPPPAAPAKSPAQPSPKNDADESDEKSSKPVQKPHSRIGRYVRVKKGEDKELVDDTEWKQPPDPARDRGYAIVIEDKINYDWYGNETSRKELLTLVSPTLVNAFHRVVKHFPGIGLNGGKVTLTSPYAPLFFYFDDLLKLADNDDDKELKDDLVHLTEFYSRRVKPTHDIIKQDQAQGNVIYKDLWSLFRPGDLVYTLDSFGEPTIHMLDATEYRAGERGMQNQYSIQRFPRFSADLWSITWDRATGLFQRVVFTRSIKSFSDSRPISALPFFPLKHYQGDLDALHIKLQQRGRLWKKLVSEQASCKFYDGPASPHFMMSGDGESLSERIVVDGAASLSMMGFYSRNGPSRQQVEQQVVVSGLMGGTNSQRVEYEFPVYGAGLTSTYDEFDDFPRGKEFSDLQAELCPATVACYALQRRSWYDVLCSKISEVEWATDTMENLVIDETTKRTLICLVEQHKKNQDKGLSDIIQFKGKGLIVVLHGNPGVGKTLTAEAVAEHTQKPLYPINIGEFTNTNDVVGQLAMHFRRASQWDAVLLMDEADVLLEKRSYENLTRNAIVSVFLRMLEYYEGILFLTTNRLLTMDAAFESRIQIAIRLPDLGPEQRRIIWNNLIRRLDPAEAKGKTELMEHLDDMERWELNGRQIRNILSMAVSLSLGSQRRRGALCYRIVEDMANEAIRFRDFFEDGAQERKAQLGIVNPRQFQERRSRW